MKKLLWCILIVFLLIPIVSSTVVLAAAGIEGFEAYQQALYAIADVVGESGDAISSVAGKAFEAIIELFEVAIQPEV